MKGKVFRIKQLAFKVKETERTALIEMYFDRETWLILPDQWLEVSLRY